MAKRPQFTVTSLGVDARYDDPGPALSRAITAATRSDVPVTVYVRDPAGDPIGYADRDEQGNIEVRRHT